MMIIGYRSLGNTLPLLAALLCACGGSMNMKKPEQGIAGNFTTAGPPAVITDCGPLVTQAEKDNCKRDNERVIVEPFQSIITVRNLGTRESSQTLLDPDGTFRMELLPGIYEVCLAEECSDPLEVRMGVFTTYGQRLPRPAAVPQNFGATTGDAPADAPR